MQGHETVMTFLFSDIEGSTRLWEGHADEMSAALKHHDELLAAAVEGNDGRVFKHTGDGICAVFAEPVAAIEAAVSAQCYFSAASWLTPHPIRIRIGIHSGKAFERGDDFFGPSLNRVARLTDAAHGGQILVSHDAAAIGRAELPSRYELVSLGQHRLRDLGPPSPVYQVGVDGQSTAFPPLWTLEAVPNNLPSQLASFVGRNDELQQVRLLLGETRLLTLTGVGGVGKTRLALHAAAAVTNDHDDGVWLVELAAVTDPQDLPDHVAAALGIRETPNVAVAEALMVHLADKAVLLILDNCEHVIDAAAKFADHHLRGCPDLQILATSREALGVGGETVWRVPSLGLPGAGAQQTDAIHLFIERASLVQPGFDPSGEELDLAEQICRRLDGIPLAIELAAARLGVLPLDQIATRLDDRFRLLTGGSRTALPRQRTLAATMDWSHDLLGTMERVLLRGCRCFTVVSLLMLPNRSVPRQICR